MSYGVGYIVPGGVAYDIQLPQGMHSFRGPSLDLQILGCKGKKDYTGKFWFFAVDNQNAPTTLWLCRAQRLPTGDIQLDYAECPLFASDPDVVCQPTQLTVDKDGNVYYAHGVTNVQDTGILKFYKATVTVEDPFTVQFTTLSVNHIADPPVRLNTVGISLSEDHTRCICYTYADLQDWYDQWDSFNVDMQIGNYQELPQEYKATVYGTNIETDVSGGYNNGLASIYDEDEDSGYIHTASPDLLGAPPDVFNTVVEDTGHNRSVSIRPDGILTTYERYNYCNTNPNRLYQYTPQVDHSYANETLFPIVCTAIDNNPTHGDVQRQIAGYPEWIASGNISDGPIGTNGTGLFVTAFLRERYSTYCTGTDREAYT